MPSTFCLTLKDLILVICVQIMSYQHWNLPSGEASPDLYLKMSEVAWDLTGLLTNEADQVHEGSPFFFG